MTATTDRMRWIALIVLCLGDFMIVLDTTIVNVALPSIRTDLGFSETGLVWVVNAYILTFGGFLLLGGRLGDLFGQRRMFLYGIVLFTLASAACGLAGSQGMLIVARAVQGFGGGWDAVFVLAAQAGIEVALGQSLSLRAQALFWDPFGILDYAVHGGLAWHFGGR